MKNWDAGGGVRWKLELTYESENVNEDPRNGIPISISISIWMLEVLQSKIFPR